MESMYFGMWSEIRKECMHSDVCEYVLFKVICSGIKDWRMIMRVLLEL